MFLENADCGFVGCCCVVAGLPTLQKTGSPCQILQDYIPYFHSIENLISLTVFLENVGLYKVFRNFIRISWFDTEANALPAINYKVLVLFINPPQPLT
jgi:hypothetical protein